METTLMETLLMALYILFGFEMLCAYVLIITRHAIPRAPRIFQTAITVPMVGSVVLCFFLAVLTRAGPNVLWGIDIIVWRTALVICIMTWLGVLIYYAYWWHMHGRNEEGR